MDGLRKVFIQPLVGLALELNRRQHFRSQAGLPCEYQDVVNVSIQDGPQCRVLSDGRLTEPAVNGLGEPSALENRPLDPVDHFYMVV